MRKLIFLLILLFAMNHAEEITVAGSNKAEYWLFRDSLDEHFEDKLNLVATYGSISGKSTFFMWDPSRPKKPKYYLNYAISYNIPELDLTYGYFYNVFGRGLTLNSYVDEDFRQELILRGVMAKLHLYENDITVLSGRPRNLFFEENSYLVKNDTTDQLRGAEFVTRLIPHLHLGGRYVRVNRELDTTITKKTFDELYGGSAKTFVGPVELYGEYVRRWGYDPILETRLSGNGYYLSGNISTSIVGIAGEYLVYDTIGMGGFGYRYNETPTPNRAGISVNRGMDEKGYGISLVSSPIDKVSLEVARTDVHNTYTRAAGRHSVDEWIGKAKIDPSENLALEAGFDRQTQHNIDVKVHEKIENKPHLDITFTPDLVNSIEMGGEYNWIESDDYQYQERVVYFGVGRSQLLSIVFRYEQREIGRILSYLDKKKEWKTLEFSWDINENQNLRVKLGNEKGGLVCSGGVCRWERPFDGVKVVLTSRF